MTKQTITKEDGRLLTYYSFGERDSEPAASEKDCSCSCSGSASSTTDREKSDS